ncbi:hypothetical protein ABPG72_015845 [Tetrahymena utriculariae]
MNGYPVNGKPQNYQPQIQNSQNRQQFQQLNEQKYPISQQEQLKKKQTQQLVLKDYGLNFQKDPSYQYYAQGYPQQINNANLNQPLQPQNNYQQIHVGNQYSQNQQFGQANPIRTGNSQQNQNQINLSKSQISSSPPHDQKKNNGFSDNNKQVNINQSTQSYMSKSNQINRSQENLQSQEAQIKRAKGCLFGAFIGDSMGSFLEFTKKAITPQEAQQAYKLPGGGIFKLAKGQLTDDGELTIMLAEGLLATKSQEPYDFLINILRKYHFWVNSKPFDFGSTMQNSWMPMNFTTYEYLLQKNQNSEQNLVQYIQQNAAKTSVGSESNGFLMKQSPIGILLWNQDKEVIFQYAELDTQFTHSNQFCIEVSKIYLYIITQLIKRGKCESFKIYCEARQIAWENNFSTQMKETFFKVESQFYGIQEQQLKTGEKDGIIQKEFPNFYAVYNAEKKIGWVRISFSYSLYVLIADLTVQKLYQGILLIGGDTDTNLCIAGAVYGAQNSIDVFPQFMIDTVQYCRPEKNDNQKRSSVFAPCRYEQLATDLYQNGLKMRQNSLKKKSIEYKNQDTLSEQNINEILQNFNIATIRNCNIEGLENCKVTNIENCYIKTIQSCQIQNIKQSRLERIQQTYVKNVQNSIIQDNQAQFQYNGTKIDIISESKFGISFI